MREVFAFGSAGAPRGPIGHAGTGLLPDVTEPLDCIGLELGFRGAGDGNRTRTISLGNQQIGAPDHADLGTRCTASDRHGPYDTRVNGPPMARGPMGWEAACQRLT